MAQGLPLQPHTTSEAQLASATRAQLVRPGGPALTDRLARDPRVRVLSDFRGTTGCLIIACPLAPTNEMGHRCAVMGSVMGRAVSISCIHPSCWHLTTEDFLEYLGLAELVVDPRVHERWPLRMMAARAGSDAGVPAGVAAHRTASQLPLGTVV